jgi:hypothetical protein
LPFRMSLLYKTKATRKINEASEVRINERSIENTFIFNYSNKKPPGIKGGF